MAITYTEKGYGLHEAIVRAGEWLAQIDGAWMSSDDTKVQAIIDGYTLAQAKADKCVLVLAYAKALRDKIVATISKGEMASWSIKRAEAETFDAAGDASQCPMLSAEASARGITLAALVAKVNTNSARFGGAEAAIGGNDGRHRDAIMALTSFDEVAAYDYSAGWPEL